VPTSEAAALEWLSDLIVSYCPDKSRKGNTVREALGAVETGEAPGAVHRHTAIVAELKQ
jgi:hypothetical protein